MDFLSEEEEEELRRAYHIERKSMRQIAREVGRSRQTVKRAVEEKESKRRYTMKETRAAPVYDSYRERVEAFLERNEKLPPKQRYTAHKIYEIIREEGCESR